MCIWKCHAVCGNVVMQYSFDCSPMKELLLSQHGCSLVPGTFLLEFMLAQQLEIG